MKTLLSIGLILNSVTLLACCFLFVNGSMELFPSETQESAVRLVWSVFIGVFVLIEIVLVGKLWKKF